MDVGLRYKAEIEINKAKLHKDLEEAFGSGMKKASRRAGSKGGSKGGFNPVSDFVDLESLEKSAAAAARIREKNTRDHFRNQKWVHDFNERQRREEERSAAQAEAKKYRIYEKFANARQTLNTENTILDAANQQKLAAFRQQIEGEILQLGMRANKMSEAELRSSLNDKLRAYRLYFSQLKREQVQEGGGRFGQQGFAIFQAQQAVEDFSMGYSLNGLSGGIRGAANNISALAALLGGPAGMIAMLGATALSIGVATDWFGLFSDSADDAASSLSDYLKLRKEQLDLDMELAGLRPLEVDPKSIKKDIADLELELKLKEREIAFNQENIKLLEELSMFTKAASSPSAAEDGDAEFFRQEAQKRRDALESRGIDPELDWRANVVGLEEYKKELESLTKERDRAAKNLEMKDTILAEVEALQKSVKAMDDAEKSLKDLSGSTKAIQALRDKGLENIEKVRATTGEQLASSQQEFEEARKKGDLEAQARILEEINRLTASGADLVERGAEFSKGWVEYYNELVESADKAAESLKESYNITMRQAEAARQLVDTENERLKVIEQQRKAQQESWEQQQFQASLQVRDLRGKEERDALKNQADARRQAAEQRMRQIDAVLNSQSRGLSRSGAGGAFGRNSRADVSAIREQAQAEYRQYLAQIDAQEQAGERDIERRQQRDVERMQRERENLLKSRAGGLSAQANEASRKGDFDQARKLNEQAREVLGQLQSLQMGQVGQGTAEQAQQAIARAQQTQQQIQATFAAESQFTTASRDRAIENYREILDIAEAIEKEMNLIKELQDNLGNDEWVNNFERARAEAQSLREEFEKIDAIFGRVDAANAAAGVNPAQNQFPDLVGDIQNAVPAVTPPAPGAPIAVGNTLNIGGLTVNAGGAGVAAITAELKAREANSQIRTGR